MEAKTIVVAPNFPNKIRELRWPTNYEAGRNFGLELLRRYWRVTHPGSWLFPARRNAARALDTTTALNWSPKNGRHEGLLL
jgi:hypothetical protein